MNLHKVLDEMYQGRTLVFGHRGASAYAPMNTIPAFELALAMGADGIELDVHYTQDGELVVLHDFTVEATTDGTGTVAEMTLSQLKELDAGNWFSNAYSGAKIPTLDEVFEAVGKQLFINVEIKSVSLENNGIEQMVADKIAHFGMKTRVIVSSFNPLALIRFRQVMPDVAVGFLFASDTPTLPSDLITELSYEATHPHDEMIDEAFMTGAKNMGYRVNTWTVNDPGRAVQLRDLGVDMLISDRPDVICDALSG